MWYTYVCGRGLRVRVRVRDERYGVRRVRGGV